MWQAEYRRKKIDRSRSRHGTEHDDDIITWGRKAQTTRWVIDCAIVDVCAKQSHTPGIISALGNYSHAQIFTPCSAHGGGLGGGCILMVETKQVRQFTEINGYDLAMPRKELYMIDLTGNAERL